MNEQLESFGKGPAIVAAQAMFESDIDMLDALRENVGWVRMYASSARFGLDALVDCNVRGNAHSIGHIQRVASRQVRSKLELMSITGSFDPELAYKYGMSFLKSAIIEPLRDERISFEASFYLEDKDDESALIAALAAINQFVVMFEVHMMYKNGKPDASPESVLAVHTRELLLSQLKEEATD